MPELRRDPLSGRWVIIATDRAYRPSDIPRAAPAPAGSYCPFCPGHEGATPPEILAYRPGGSAPNGPGWTVRVVPNRFPALMIEGDLDRSGSGLYDRMHGIGAHEVIVESPNHAPDLGDQSVDQVEAVLAAFRDRFQDLRRDIRFRSILVFKNRGRPAGATLDHGHSQLIALPILPAVVADELESAKRHFEAHERCLFCDIVAQERREAARVVAENDEAIAFAPWAARSPFETWVMPRKHHSHFEETSRGPLRGVAALVRDTLKRLDVALEKPAYNFMLHTAPLREQPMAHYHWHFEIVPALSQVAGFEWGSGFHINPTPPEEAAAFLRKLEI
ncbi:MAG: galactose-1-phosphate uridylyltransferase [Deltaproteobacteria bacterium]|nr:galactose-1-phosphate uridylyltransferase [Deltaproteobacteria bacterium]